VERVRKALNQGKESAFLSRQLATVRTDVPIETDLKALKYSGQGDKSKLQGLFTELGFSRLLKELDGPRFDVS